MAPVEWKSSRMLGAEPRRVAVEAAAAMRETTSVATMAEAMDNCTIRLRRLLLWPGLRQVQLRSV